MGNRCRVLVVLLRFGRCRGQTSTVIVVLHVIVQSNIKAGIKD
jgi:hypothetical protein